MNRGHDVTAIVRHPKKLNKRDRLTAVRGDANDSAALTSVIVSHDALISAFNPGWMPGAPQPEMYEEQIRGTTSIINAVKKSGIKRALRVGGAGGLEVTPSVQLIDTPNFPHWIKPGSRATTAALEALRNEPELEWSFPAPFALLKPGERTGKFRLGDDQLLVDSKGERRISLQDYAVAMIDELEKPTHIGQRFTVGYQSRTPTKMTDPSFNSSDDLQQDLERIFSLGSISSNQAGNSDGAYRKQHPKIHSNQCRFTIRLNSGVICQRNITWTSGNFRTLSYSTWTGSLSLR